MRCNSCGAPMQPDELFCGSCGAPAAPSPAPVVQPERSKFPIWVIGAVAAVAVVVVVVILVLALGLVGGGDDTVSSDDTRAKPAATADDDTDDGTVATAAVATTPPATEPVPTTEPAVEATAATVASTLPAIAATTSPAPETTLLETTAPPAPPTLPETTAPPAPPTLPETTAPPPPPTPVPTLATVPPARSTPVVEGVAASVQRPDSEDGCGTPTAYPPENALDGRQDTAWMAPGDGTGAEMFFDLGVRSIVRTLGLTTGYDKFDTCVGEDRFVQLRRVSRVRWTFDDGSFVDQPLDVNVRGVQRVTLLNGVTTASVRLTIIGTIPPGVARLDHTPVSEIEIR